MNPMNVENPPMYSRLPLKMPPQAAKPGLPRAAPSGLNLIHPTSPRVTRRKIRKQITGNF